MRPKPILAAVTVLAVLGLIARQVTQAVRHTFAPPAGLAQVDRASPQTQNQLTLMEIDNVSPDRTYTYTDAGPQDSGGSSNFSATDTGLWVKLPPNYTLPPNCIGSQYTPCANSLSITGRASTGETFPLAWNTSNSGGSQGNQTYLLASLPAGYPDTFRWVDVTVDTRQGDKGTWRVSHLPPMQHVIAPPVQAQTTFQTGSIRAIAHAYGGPDPNQPSQSPGIRYDVKGTIQGASHQWEIGHMTETSEWEPPGYVPQEAGQTMGAGKVGGAVILETEDLHLFYNRGTPYMADTHWVRLGASLQEFETHDETVTFHNVSVFKLKIGGQYLVGAGPQAVTTPSGVTVTLDDVQHKPNFTGSWGGNGCCLHLLYPQGMVLSTLPQSPFWRKYKTLVKISADIPKPYIARGSSSSSNDGTYSFGVVGPGVDGYSISAPLPKVIANFPVIIRQRVDLRSVPMTFTLPVANKPPKTRL